MRVTPKINVSPDAMRNRTIAFASPLRNWIARNCSAQVPEGSAGGGIAGRDGGPLPARRREPSGSGAPSRKLALFCLESSTARAELLYLFVRWQHLLAG